MNMEPINSSHISFPFTAVQVGEGGVEDVVDAVISPITAIDEVRVVERDGQ